MILPAIASLMHTYPLLRGAGRVVRRLRLDQLVQDETTTAWARLRDGQRLLVHPRDYCGAPIYFTGDYDRRLSVILKRTLRPGDAMIDIGANYGLYAVQAARLVTPAGKVLAIEPQAELANMIQQSADRNGLTQLDVHRLALSHEDGQAMLKVGQPHPETHIRNRGGAHLTQREGVGTPVDVKHAGRWLGEQLPRPARVIKIDVEKHEDIVLPAMGDYLDQFTPAIVLIEQHHDKTPLDQRPAVQTLLDRHYELWQIESTLTTLRCQRTLSPKRDDDSIDYIALHTPAVANEPDLPAKVGCKG